mmetsp:Transcript_18813/g.71218  ORF Transcript_18813/g.71218 Transcript_18813/m.71218 type:complete len:260 (-) Transcript_18813:72-851(-)
MTLSVHCVASLVVLNDTYIGNVWPWLLRPASDVIQVPYLDQGQGDRATNLREDLRALGSAMHFPRDLRSAQYPSRISDTSATNWGRSNEITITVGCIILALYIDFKKQYGDRPSVIHAMNDPSLSFREAIRTTPSPDNLQSVATGSPLERPMSSSGMPRTVHHPLVVSSRAAEQTSLGNSSPSVRRKSPAISETSLSTVEEATSSESPLDEAEARFLERVSEVQRLLDRKDQEERNLKFFLRRLALSYKQAAVARDARE